MGVCSKAVSDYTGQGLALFHTEEKRNSSIFLGDFFFSFRVNTLTYRRGVLLLSGAWVSAEACTIELLSAVVHRRLHR